MAESEKQIREDVRRYYAQLAQEGSSCCGPSGCGSLYPEEQLISLADIPSLGCADPISAAHLSPGETVLDLGSGAGLDCFLAARQVGPTGRVIGVDMTDEMLERARRNAQRLGLLNVEFRKGLIEALPLEDASVDAVVSNCVINLSPDKESVFRELARVLRPGGRLVVADIVSNGELDEPFRSAENWAACVAGALRVDQYIESLQASGLVQASCRTHDARAVSEIPPGIPFSALIMAVKPA